MYYNHIICNIKKAFILMYYDKSFLSIKIGVLIEFFLRFGNMSFFIRCGQIKRLLNTRTYKKFIFWVNISVFHITGNYFFKNVL